MSNIYIRFLLLIKKNDDFQLAFPKQEDMY